MREFLDAIADPSETLYFEYAVSNAVTTNPLWGQMVYRYEIKGARCEVDDRYSMGNIYERAVVVVVRCIIGPHAEGLKQRLASAIGGVFEDNIGTADGQSRGVNIPVTIVNKCDNPIFGNASYHTEWTVGASLTASKNTDPKYVLFGSASMKIIRNASVVWHVYQSIAAGNTNTHVGSF